MKPGDQVVFTDHILIWFTPPAYAPGKVLTVNGKFIQVKRDGFDRAHWWHRDFWTALPESRDSQRKQAAKDPKRYDWDRTR